MTAALRATSSISSLHVVAGLYAEHGGPTYSVPRLCRALGEAGSHVELYSVLPKSGKADTAPFGSYIDRRFPWDLTRIPLLSRLRWSRQLGHELHRVAPQIGVIHNHGIWLLPNIQSADAAAESGRPLVISFHGMLAPEALAFATTRKRIFWKLLQRKAVRRAACIHATSEQEYQEVRAAGLENPVAVIPNGVDLFPPRARKFSEAGEYRTMLSLGRIHPKKGLDRLVVAWARVENEFPNWRLRIAGPSELGHASKLQQLINKLRTKQVSIEAPAYGDAKFDLYASSEAFVLPTLNENFGLTVAEAMAAGLPVITTKGAPWADLSTHGCGWWIDHGPEALAQTLREVMSTPKEVLQAMGAKGRAWMERDFAWDPIARDMLDVYHWLVSGGKPPHTIRLK